MKIKECQTGFVHFCEGCQGIHVLPYPNEGWTFNGDKDKPTFTPSFKHAWGDPAKKQCHYTITNGIVHFYSDSSHTLRGDRAMLELPENYLDFY